VAEIVAECQLMAAKHRDREREESQREPEIERESHIAREGRGRARERAKATEWAEAKRESVMTTESPHLTGDCYCLYLESGRKVGFSTRLSGRALETVGHSAGPRLPISLPIQKICEHPANFSARQKISHSY